MLQAASVERGVSGELKKDFGREFAALLLGDAVLDGETLIDTGKAAIVI